MRKAVGWTGYLTRTGFYIREGGDTMHRDPDREQKEVMLRLTPTVIGLMKNPVALLGQRIGIASDFRTGLEERAVAACREYAAAWKEQEHFHSHGSKGKEVLATGREILAAETPKPRYQVQASASDKLPHVVMDTRYSKVVAGFVARIDADEYARRDNEAEDK